MRRRHKQARRGKYCMRRKGRETLIEQDTVKLLRECDAGVRMGTDSIHGVLEFVSAQPLRDALRSCEQEHRQLGREIRSALQRFGDDGKAPNPIAEKMSWLKSSVKLALHESDHTIADLMTDGCNMGVKSLSRYLNQYAAADEDSKAIAGRLIRLEEKLSEDMRAYL